MKWFLFSDRKQFTDQEIAYPLSFLIIFPVILFALAMDLALKYIIPYQSDLAWSWQRPLDINVEMNKITIKAVIFDFDGTVVDSMPFLENNAVKLMVRHYGISAQDAREKYVKTTGLPFLEQIGVLFPGHEANNAVINTFEELKEEGLLEQPLFPDTGATFEYLKSQHYLLCISSSSLKPAIVDYFRKSGHLDLLDEIMGYRIDFQKGKDHFNHVKRLFKLKETELVFVGDSLKDFERAQNSGVQFIGKLGLFSKEDFTREGHSGKVISKLTELREML